MAAQPGVDGQSFADIEAYGDDRWLDELAEELRKGDVSALSRFGACTSLKGMASKGRWAFLA